MPRSRTPDADTRRTMSVDGVDLVVRPIHGTLADEKHAPSESASGRPRMMSDMNDTALPPPGTGWQSLVRHRGRSATLAQLALFAGLLFIDELMSGRLGLRQAGGGLSTVVVLTIVALTLLRDRLPTKLEVVAATVIGLSLAHTAVAALFRLGISPLPVGLSITETVAVGVMVGAVARRGSGWYSVALIAAGSAAMTAAPFARTGVGIDVKMFAAPGALIWGMAVAFGLVLRDTDARRSLALRDALTAERMRLARELHDLVTHHVTGIAVRAQAAQIVAARQNGQVEADGFAQIEQAASASLTAMRELVGMLRSEDGLPDLPATGIRAALDRAVADEPRATVELPEDVESIDPGPDVAATLHWITLEALTNVRRHAQAATQIRITVRIDGRMLVLEISNDGAEPPSAADDPRRRYGLVGMRERLAAVGGELTAGPEDSGRWRIDARVPISRNPGRIRAAW
jgi:signal transduction histidine kinase